MGDVPAGQQGDVLRLTFATLRYYPFGGLEKSFLNICKEAIRRGHVLTIYCSSWEGERLPGARIIEVPLSKHSNHARLAEFHQKVMAARSHEPDDVFVGFKRIPDLDLYYNGDVCFIDEAARKHGRWYQWTPRYRHMAAFEQAVFSTEVGTEILFISPREKEIYQRVYGTPEQRFHELPAGIDKQAIRAVEREQARVQVRAELGCASDDTVLIMVGSDFRRKGVDRAIRALAAANHPRARLWVVGTGERAPYVRLANKLGVAAQVQFLGGRSDVPVLLGAADILFHPAVVETAGNAILEGMVAGLPVIVSASAGFSAHVARAGGGLVVDDQPFEQARFDEAVARLLASPSLAMALGSKGYAYADETDLYRRPKVAVDVMEAIARRKRGADLAG